MDSSEVLTVTENGNLTLPPEIIERYHIKNEMQFRVIETQKGVLLVPLTDEPMSTELKTEIAQWQELGTTTWERFGFEDAP